MASDLWPRLPLGELTENFDGRRVPVKESERRPGPYPYYGASGVVDHVDGYLFDGEFLLIGEDGENLRTRQTPIAFLATGKFWVNNHAHIVRGNDRAHTRYLCYALSQTEIAGYLTGSTMPKLTQANLNRLPIVAPPLPEQRAIASVLGALDDKIDLNRRMCQTLEEMARALFKSWFVDFDPVRAKMEGRDPNLPKEIAELFPSRLVDSELGPIPEGWTTGHVGDLAALNPESWTVKSRPGAVRYLDLASAKWGRFDEAQCLAGDAIPSRAQRVLKPGDSVVGTVRPGNGSFGLIHDDELTGSTGFAVLRPTATRNRVYVYLSVTAAENIDRLSRLADGGAYPAVRPDVVGATPCVHPPARLLEHVELIAGSWLDRVAACESESRSLAALRDTLLPKLISGEVRLPASLGSMQELSG
jgi:type I restriction enzyme S subunit